MSRAVSRRWWAAALATFVGAVAAVLLFGVQSDSRKRDIELRQAFADLSPKLQHEIRMNAESMRSQTPEKQAALRQIGESAQQDPTIASAAKKFTSWWTGLSDAERDEFLTLPESERLQHVRSALTRVASEVRPIRIEFAGPPSASLPELRLTFETFGKILDEALADVNKPASLQQELSELPTQPQKTLRTMLWMFDNVRQQRQPKDMDRRSQAFETALLKHCDDAAWKRKYEQLSEGLKNKPFRRSWMLITQMKILGDATTALGRDLQQKFPVTDQQILDAFDAIEDKTLRQELMTLPASEFRVRMTYLAEAGSERTPEERLLAKFIQFEAERERMLRFMTFDFGGGPGGPGVPRGGPGGGQGAFQPDRNGPRRGDNRP